MTPVARLRARSPSADPDVLQGRERLAPTRGLIRVDVDHDDLLMLGASQKQTFSTFTGT